MTILIALIAALACSLGLYAVLPWRDTKTGTLRVMGLQDERTLIETRSQARTLVRRAFPQLSHWLYWARVRGEWVGWTEETIVAAQLGVGVATLVLVRMLQLPSSPLVIAFVSLSFIILINRLHSGYQHAARQVAQDLPMVAMAIATVAERGVPPEQALRRISEVTAEGTLVSRWIAEVLSTHPASLPLSDWLAEQAQRSGISSLVSFALTLQSLSRRGQGVNEFYTLAQQTVNSYVASVQQRVKQLDNQMSLLVSVFFFLPYVALVAAPLLQGVMSIL